MIKKDDYIQKDEIAKIITYKQQKEETEKKEIITREERESKNTGMESLEASWYPERSKSSNIELLCSLP